jgi:hypothetical protein
VDTKHHAFGLAGDEEIVVDAGICLDRTGEELQVIAGLTMRLCDQPVQR